MSIDNHPDLALCVKRRHEVPDIKEGMARYEREKEKRATDS